MAEASNVTPLFPNQNDLGSFASPSKLSDVEMLQEHIKEMTSVMRALLTEVIEVKQLLRRESVIEGTFDEESYRAILESIDTETFKHVKWDL